VLVGRFSIALTLAALCIGGGLITGPLAGGVHARPDTAADHAPIGSLADAVGGVDAVDPAQKLSPGLVEVARAGTPGRMVRLIVQSVQALDLGAYSDSVHAFTWPAGEHVAVLQVAAKDVLAIAALPSVYQVDWADADAPVDRPPGALEPAPAALAPAELRRRLDAAPSWWQTKALIEATAAGSRGSGEAGDVSGAAPAPDGWWDVRAGHAAREAWDLGYKGDGVRVAVLDFPIDFAHPDLQGTWAVLPPGHPYEGWPQAFDPVVGYLRIQDKPRPVAQQSTRTASSGMIELYQDSDIVDRQVGGVTRPTSCFQPLQLIIPAGSPFGTIQLGGTTCDFVVPTTSKSGVVRFGHHPDPILRAYGARPDTEIAGEYAGVLLVDEKAAGEYDTVYIDLDLDRDFSDEKPVSKADPLPWRDMDGDAIADVSGGLLYFISDGELSFPGSWVWGLDGAADIPPAGRFVGIHWWSGGDHGTLCGSNVVAQGRIGVPPGHALKFRDLPGDHEPPGVNFGLAPEGEMVSIGSVYAFGRAMFAPAWRYAVFGHDVARDDDQIQVTSNSYGWSNEDNDGWDPDSRLIDFYVRRYSPNTSFLFATGNGGTGYGTLAPPSPSVAIDVAASTQFGSTGADSITDTTQITFGDIIPFSNRGPGANGQNGPDVAADGAFAAGAEPLNIIYQGGGNGRLANGTWGGTSRATPVAAGALTLVYQAFKAGYGRWPTWAEARAVLMAGARFNGYDTFTAGGGVVDAADSVRIAAGKHGVYAVPSEWTAGHYRGAKYPAFAKLLSPGESDTAPITLKNPSDHPIDVTLAAKTLRRIGSYDDALVTDRTKETTVGPDYLIPIDRNKVPAGTELMIVRGRYPYSEFDVGADLVADNFYTPGVLQHTDINGDGKLWVDKNQNGVVNNKALTPLYLKLTWDDQTREDDAVEGAFTKPLGDDGLTAEIAWYGLGCSDENGNPPLPAQEIQEKIALIERGTCTFFQKLTNAKNAGAIAAVVFTDARPVAIMGSNDGPIDISGIMIEREDGLALQAVLEAEAKVTAGMLRRTNIILKGIDGAAPIRYENSDIQRYEYMTVNSENGLKNHWALPVHHPRERWADGLYLWLTHSGRSTVVTNTHITMRVDFYAYRDWNALSLAQSRVTIPAKGEVTLDATLRVPADAPYGGLQGAIFVDYERGAGDRPVQPPAGYELPNQRVVIPVNTTVGATYAWKGSLTLGGAKADDRDAPYNNGAVQGTFKWNWRPESGDWRTFFVDIAEKSQAGTFWLLRTTWQDDAEKQSDIDTRVFGPAKDRQSNPDDPANRPNPNNPTAPVEDRSDPSWFGPYTLNLLARSAYLVVGSTWPFNTSTGKNEDWLALTPASDGLHEVMLHNVLFSGSQFEMPYETTVSAIHVASRTGTQKAGPAVPSSGVTLLRDVCSQLEITSEMDMPEFSIRGFGMAAPQVAKDSVILQDMPNDRNTSSFKRDVKLADQAGRFTARTRGKAGDDLDLFILRDANGNGTFEFPAEVLAQSGGETADEEATLVGLAPPGDYQVWVHGYALAGGATESRFDFTLEVVVGNTIQLGNAPAGLVAGRVAVVDVCADQGPLAGEDGPAYGLVVFGPGSMPGLFQVPVTWWRNLPQRVFMPAAANREAVER